MTQKIVPVILSGGTGSRLWPLSRDAYPKQFIGVVDINTPLIQQTIRRVINPDYFHPPLIVGNNTHRFLLAEQLRVCGIDKPDIIIEPCVRNTAPAIIAAALHVQKTYGDALMLILPTDQAIMDPAAFFEGIKRAAETAQKNYLVTFGITPEHPETGYGYIKRGETLKEAPHSFAISSFVEKPQLEKAKEFIASGDYYWNSGMFMFPTKLLLDEMQQLQPDMVKACKDSVAGEAKDLDFLRLDETSFASAPSLSIDYALMEHTKHAAVVPLQCGWSDTGAWDLLWQISNKDAQGNAIFGDCHLLDTKNSYVRSEDGPAVATLGVDNMIIVATKDAVMVASKDKAQSVKQIVEKIKQANPQLVSDSSRVYRPWGMYESLNHGARFQVKRITVKPGEKLSLQLHKHRAEHWVVVSGIAKVTCDDKVSTLTENQSIYIPCGSKHRIENPGSEPLDIIEVQSGEYLGEDDIVRFDDAYGRTGK